MKNIFKKIIEKKRKKTIIREIFFLVMLFFSFPNLTFAAECAGNPVGATCLKQDKCTNGLVDSSLYSDCAGDEICCKPTASSTGSASVNSTATPASGSFQYTLLESLPGFFQAGKVMTDFPALILAIYKFGIWTIGICALFMITIGGVMYLGSAGNTSAATNAKGIIFDALIGVFAAMVAYLFLYVINPDLTTININFSQVSLTGSSSSGSSGAGSSGSGGGGSCEVMTSGPCAVANLTSTFSTDAEKMSKICNLESGGNVLRESGTDLCADGKSFSIGLYQVNMMTSAGSIGCDGSQIFTGIGSRTSSYDCLDHKTNSNGVSYCAHRNCRVVDVAKYNECKAKLENGTTNIQVAGSLYQARRFNPWSKSAGICGVN